MRKKIYILAVFILSALFIGGEFFDFLPAKIFTKNLGGQVVFAAGTATVQTTIKITVCGNNIKETEEQCDGSDLGGASCSSRGFSGGTLSCKGSCEFNTSGCTTNGGGGGGGGYVSSPVITSIIFEGRAYPLTKVVVLKDGQIAVSTIAGPDARFEVNLTELATGDYTFAVYGEDGKGLRSSLFTFPIYISSGATTKVSGIFIAPTIAIDKSEVKRGDNIAIFGQSAPQSEITIAVNSEEEFFVKTPADKDGVYLYNFDTTPLDMGQHFTKSKTALNGEISSFSKAIGFLVGTKNVASVLPTKCPAKTDLNGDCRVNLVDFSITAYWYKRSSPPASIDLNGDGKIDLIDFSIMAFYWTG